MIPINIILQNFIGNQKIINTQDNIDCDIYSSTKDIFDIAGDRINPGCIIVFDEYINYPSWEQHEFKAF